MGATLVLLLRSSWNKHTLIYFTRFWSGFSEGKFDFKTESKPNQGLVKKKKKSWDSVNRENG